MLNELFTNTLHDVSQRSNSLLFTLDSAGVMRVILSWSSRDQGWLGREALCHASCASSWSRSSPPVIMTHPFYSESISDTSRDNILTWCTSNSNVYCRYLFGFINEDGLTKLSRNVPTLVFIWDIASLSVNVSSSCSSLHDGLFLISSPLTLLLNTQLQIGFNISNDFNLANDLELG